MRRTFVAFAIFVAAAVGGPNARAQDHPALTQALQAVVGIRALIPPEARTADILGTERGGNGVIIGADGLILTVGYLIMESTEVMVLLSDGSVIQGRAVGFDWDTGFGLIRAASAARVRAPEFADSAALKAGDAVVLATRGGDIDAVRGSVLSRREFAGYWEYVLPNAIFTAPVIRNWGGAALFTPDGKLLGIGSLAVRNAKADDEPSPGNMFIPIDALKPVLADMLAFGGRQDSDRPWIGVNTLDMSGRLVITNVTAEAPAAKAGLRRGDRIVAVAGRPILGQGDFYKKIWAAGKPGGEIVVSVRRGEEAIDAKINPISRKDWLKTPDPR